METVMVIKDQKRMLVFDGFGSRSQPILSHFLKKFLLATRGSINAYQYVAERAFGQWVMCLDFKGVYCMMLDEPTAPFPSASSNA
jgi:hypothetical protein